MNRMIMKNKMYTIGIISILLLVGFAALPVMSSTVEIIEEINNSSFASNSNVGENEKIIGTLAKEIEIPAGS
ncbi:MAG: hypothetical protein KAW45_09335, partial [Thermoplasmatales archaeon]|nr:hypothetical protein [Thermoplasmatales archaeon]